MDRTRSSRILFIITALAVLAAAGCSRETKAPDAGQVKGPAVAPKPPEVVVAPPTYAQLMEQGKVLLESRDYAAARERFQQAVSTDGSQYDGYFHLAVVAYRQDNLTAAQEYAQLALDKTPDDGVIQKPIEQMLTVIAEKRRFEKLEAEGDEAYENGRMAKAADAYQQAYALFPKRGQTGLRAATIYADTLNRLLDAAILWQKVAAAGEAEPAGVAREELNRRRPELDALFQTQIAIAKKPGDIALLERLAAAFPQSKEAPVELAFLHAQRREAERVIANLAKANKAGLTPAEIFGHEQFLKLRGLGAKFDLFIEEAYGKDTLTAMGAEFDRRDKVAAEQRRQEEARRRARLLQIVVAEPQAEIWVNGRLEGKKEVTLNDRAAGDYRVELRLNGYKAYKTTLAHKADASNAPHRFSFAELSAKNIACPTCTGKGTTAVTGRCPACNGRGTIRCDYCNGKGGRETINVATRAVTGWIYCDMCKGRQVLKCEGSGCENGTFRGTNPCTRCQATGKVSKLDLSG